MFCDVVLCVVAVSLLFDGCCFLCVALFVVAVVGLC